MTHMRKIVSRSKKLEITKYVETERTYELELPQTVGNNLTLTTIGFSSFSGSRYLKSVSMPNTVLYINAYAFANCVNLRSIKLSKKLKYIGDCAFMNCYSLKTIYLPKKIKYISKNAFKRCDKLLILCHENSYAHIYAMKHNIEFAIVNDMPI